MAAASVGVLKCQSNSYAKTFQTRVIRCEPKAESDKSQSKNEPNVSNTARFVIQLADTIMFPEGGGQPNDRGTIEGKQVYYVGRTPAGKVLHYVEDAIEVGSEVTVEIDWQRRFDHMQQHSAQHLISALAEQKFGWNTTSWWLGLDRCNIEFDTSKHEPEQLLELEQASNQIIREARPVTVKVVERDNEVDKDNHHGALRKIEIENLDSNECCGTHVSKTSDLQVVKFLGSERARGQLRLFFNAGNRVVNMMEKLLERERVIKILLTASPEEHIALIERLQKDYRAELKAKKSLLDELAELTATNLANQLLTDESIKRHRVLTFHRSDVDTLFLNAISKSLQTIAPDCYIMLSAESTYLVQGNEKVLTPEVFKQVTAALAGKGGGKAGRYAGKANTTEQQRKAAREIIIAASLSASQT